MNLLYLANIRLPTEKAHGLQIMKTCEALAKAGATVELAVPTRENALSEDPFSFYGIQQTFEFTKVNTPDLVRFGRLGFFLTALWFSEKARWLPSFRNADVVYSRDALVLLQYVLLGRPFAYEAHAKPTAVSRFVAKRAVRLVTISCGLKEAYRDVGVPEDRITVAPDAVDESLFASAPERVQARVELDLPNTRTIVLYAGHLYARKGAGTLAAAAHRVPDVLFLFVGGTDADIARFSERWGKEENIHVVGRVPHTFVPTYLRAADILVLPNSGRDADSARYTSPMKLFEYMASGTPIIASDVPALREVVDDASAYFFKPDDAEALAAGIRYMMSEPFAALEKGRRAREAAARYTWDARARTILASLS